jgi:hypothetical protein
MPPTTQTQWKPVVPAGEPYCGNCGHQLTGCVDSSKCPECGRPIVEVLTRSGGKWGPRYRSRTTLWGLPLIHVAIGATASERFGHAKGVIAVGDKATGLVAVGGQARGLVAVGGMAMGGVALGGMSIGLIGAWGGMAVGAMAAGGLAIGLLVSGGLGMGYVAAGGMAIGRYAAGGAPIGQYALGPGANAPEAQQMFGAVNWFFGLGPRFTIMSMLQPMFVIIGLALLLTVIVGATAVFAHLRSRRSRTEPAFTP